MDPDAYEYHLKRARDRLLSSRNYMSLFVPIRGSDQELLDRYLGFVSNVESALRLQGLLYLSVLFDTDPDTGGLPTLVRLAQNHPKELAQWATPEDLRTTKKKLSAHPMERFRLKSLRDGELAHLSITQSHVGIQMPEYDSLWSDAESVVKDLYLFYYKGGYTADEMHLRGPEDWMQIVERIK